MKVKELILRLQQCNQNYEAVFSQVIALRENGRAELEKISIQDAHGDDWIIRRDSPLGPLYADNSASEICLFPSHDEFKNPVEVDTEKFGLCELT